MKNIKVFMLPILIFMSACSPKNERNINLTNPENGEKTNVKITTDKDGKHEYNIKNQNGDIVVLGGKDSLPKSFPEFITIYPGATNLSSIDAQSEQNKEANVSMVNFTTNDDAAKIIAFYKSKLEPMGYMEKGNFKYSNMVMTSLVNDKTEQTLQITANKGENETATNVQLIFAKQNKK